MVIPSGFRVEHLRVGKGREFIRNGFQDYCLQTGVSLEYASTNTPQQIGMSERVGRTLAAMVRCMLADSGLPKFLWGELMFTAAFLGNRAPHSAVGMQSPYKMLHGTEPDLRLLQVNGARAFVHIETYSKNLELKAVEGRLVGYSNNSKSYRVYNPATRRVMQSRSVVFIETPSRLFPPPLEESSPQINPPNNGMSDHNYSTDDDFLRDLRDYTSVLESLLGASADHITVGELSNNPPVAELLERISEITRRDTLDGGATGPPQEGAMPWGIAYGRSFAGGRSRTTGAGDITRGSVPGNTTGWITDASTAGTFASRSDSCG